MDLEFEKIKKIIIEQLDVDEFSVTKDTSIINDLRANPMDNIELIMALESEFKIEILEEDTDKFFTVQDIVEYIKLKCSPATG